MAISREVKPVRSPFRYSLIGNAKFTLGAEGGNARNIGIQLQTPRFLNLPKAGVIRGYLASDAAGANLTQVAPDSLTAGAAGSVFNSSGDASSGLLVIGTLTISATAEKFKTTTTAKFLIGGQILSKAATDNLVFSANNTVAGTKYGIVLVQIDAAGTITTKAPLLAMTYASAAAALAALPAPDAGKIALGYITLDNSTSKGSGAAGLWTANTDDLTNGSDITAAAFVDGALFAATRSFKLVSNASGLVNLIIATAAVVTYYLVLELPDGSILVSSPIAFT